MHLHRHVWRHGRHGFFKGSAVVIGIVLYVLAILFKAKWLVAGLNVNQELIRIASLAVEQIFPAWGDTVEAGMRSWNLERSLLLLEMIAAVKLIMLAVGGIFRSCYQRLRR